MSKRKLKIITKILKNYYGNVTKDNVHELTFIDFDNKDTNIDKCINIALEQHFENSILKDYYVKHNIKSSIVDMKEDPICKIIDNTKAETDVGSCDRWRLLHNMLKGSYTESNTAYGNFESDKYEFVPDLYIKYKLSTDKECFIIEHKCAFINITRTRLIPIQENSLLTR